LIYSSNNCIQFVHCQKEEEEMKRNGEAFEVDLDKASTSRTTTTSNNINNNNVRPTSR
jgi:hypothetical protein